MCLASTVVTNDAERLAATNLEMRSLSAQNLNHVTSTIDVPTANRRPSAGRVRLPRDTTSRKAT